MGDGQRRGAAVKGQEQRGALPVRQALEHAGDGVAPGGIAGGDELEVDSDRAAADHFQRPGGVEGVVLDLGLFGGQSFFAFFDGVQLHRATADGAAEQALLAAQHLGPGPPGGGAAVGDDGT